METSENSLSNALIAFSQRFVTEYKQKLGHFPLVEKDEEWPSPCEISPFDEEFMQWQPVAPNVELAFGNIEQALELKLHADIKCYFTSLFSESIPATCEHGHLQLIFAWSEKDFERLQSNIIGHVMMKRKLKQEVTLFFAVTDDEDNIISLNNETGEVWVEKVGSQPHKKLAGSIEEFLAQISPDIYIEQ